MCLAIPGKIHSLHDNLGVPMAKVDFGGITREACLSFVPEARIGDVERDGTFAMGLGEHPGCPLELSKRVAVAGDESAPVQTQSCRSNSHEARCNESQVMPEHARQHRRMTAGRVIAAGGNSGFTQPVRRLGSSLSFHGGLPARNGTTGAVSMSRREAVHYPPKVLLSAAISRRPTA